MSNVQTSNADTYHQNHSSAPDEITSKAFLDDVFSRMNIKGSQYLANELFYVGDVWKKGVRRLRGGSLQESRLHEPT